uniref:40S ribosomal protein S7 n=1 Tax=Allodiplogaster sudhausi TaxID=2761625 RepID=C8CLV5_9BILA|nr:small subunit ribosomal protein 7 [Allodiplogaster sudhausi]
MPEIIGKLVKPDGKPASEIEKQISNALADLEANSDIKQQLRELYIVGVKEVEISNKKSIIIFVPVPQLKQFQKVHARIVRELEKKLGGKHIVFIARRRILPKPQRGNKRVPQKQKRPRSRTLTAVHDAILNDIVYPAEIVGKRTRVKLDGKRIIKVHLDKTQQTTVEHKTETFSNIYKNLTGKDVVFEFPEPLF